MVSVHYENYRLIIFGQSSCQFLHELIHLVDLVYIVFILILSFLIRCAGNLDLWICYHLFCWIFAMALHWNRINIISLAAGIQSIHYLWCQYLILCPPLRSLLYIAHIFKWCKRIITYIIKYNISVVEHCSVVVDGMCAVPQTA